MDPEESKLDGIFSTSLFDTGLLENKHKPEMGGLVREDVGEDEINKREAVELSPVYDEKANIQNVMSKHYGDLNGWAGTGAENLTGYQHAKNKINGVQREYNMAGQLQRSRQGTGEWTNYDIPVDSISDPNNLDRAYNQDKRNRVEENKLPRNQNFNLPPFGTEQYKTNQSAYAY